MTVTSEGLPLKSKFKIGREEGVSSFPHTATSCIIVCHAD